MFGRPPSRLSQQQPLALPGDEVKDPRLGASPALSTEDVLIYAALYAVFDPREGVEVEIEEALAITISNEWWQKISDEALAVATVRASSPKPKR
ncbi:hypothetical protein TGAMA5MH_10335 [Trichoderma gamsii]|uniref:Uncharacterized protein n=1 Tax=Trichoderma gamsii TaxID=398673 RepID=A0A2K0SX41_9HYPO|nr:hypothetical protein TGAMA5MH_10335 [Trichoderma gamsii]